MKKVVVVGSSNIDSILRVKAFPKPGETVNALSISEAGGGKGANQAIAAAKSGMQVSFISRVGEDNYGRDTLSQLKTYGVDITYVQTTVDRNTGHAYITVNEQGQNNIIIDHGANYDLNIEDIDAAKDVIEDSDVVITQFETPIEVAIEAFKLAKNANKTTILNPAPAIKNIPQELIELTDLIIPNEAESTVITGIDITDQASLEANANAIHRLGIDQVIITVGSDGAYISTPKLVTKIPAYKVDAIDTTAAGDTFIGFFTSKLNEDHTNLEEAVKYACLASSIAVQRIGAQPSIPTKAEVKELIDEETTNG